MYRPILFWCSGSRSLSSLFPFHKRLIPLKRKTTWRDALCCSAHRPFLYVSPMMHVRPPHANHSSRCVREWHWLTVLRVEPCWTHINPIFCRRKFGFSFSVLRTVHIISISLSATCSDVNHGKRRINWLHVPLSAKCCTNCHLSLLFDWLKRPRHVLVWLVQGSPYKFKNT